MFVDLRANVADDEGCLAKINWTLRTFRLDELTDYYKNPRSLSDKEFKQLKTSLDKFGMIDKPIVNLDSANTIIGGHQRKHVLEATGVKECECWIPDRVLSDKEVEELNIRLNKNTGSWDFDTLANEFQLDDLLDWGFDKGELDLDLWADDAPEDVEPQIDKADELQEKWNVQVGQVWQLGEHRIICGDSTDGDVVRRLMGEQKAHICWTDPPWNVAYGQSFNNTRTDNPMGWKKRTIANDNLGDKFPEFVEGFVAQIHETLVPGGILYMAMSAQEWGVIMQALTESGFHWSSTIIWAKDTLVVSRKDYHTQYEPIWYGWKDDAARVCVVDDRKQSDLWQIPRPKRSDEHPTMKPVELVERALRNSSKPGDVVFEPFAGSGTDIIACERSGRKCMAIELEPKYIAVSIQRWVDVTGGEPVLLDT
jgi:DNA modification methylase